MPIKSLYCSKCLKLYKHQAAPRCLNVEVVGIDQGGETLGARCLCRNCGHTWVSRARAGRRAVQRYLGKQSGLVMQEKNEMTEEQALFTLRAGEAFTIEQLMKVTLWPYNKAARHIELWRRRSTIVKVEGDGTTRYQALSPEEVIRL